MGLTWVSTSIEKKHKHIIVVDVCNAEVIEMLPPTGSGWYSYLASFGVDNNNLQDISAERRPRCHRVEDRLHGTGSIYTAGTWFDEMLACRNLRLYNSFLSALLAADALNSSATTSPSPETQSTFPLNVPPSETTSGCHPVSRSPVPLIRRQSSRYSLEQQTLQPPFGIKKSMLWCKISFSNLRSECFEC